MLVVGDYRGNNGSGPKSGRAWVYEFDGAVWNDAAVLEPGPSNGNDFFGLHVEVDGDVIAATAPYADGFGESSLGRVEVFQRKAQRHLGSGGAPARVGRVLGGPARLERRRPRGRARRDPGP